MALTTGNDYDHIDISDGTDTIRHYLKDTVARNDLIKAQSSQPSESGNKIWFPDTTPEGVEVPTYAEFSNLMSAFVDYADNFIGGDNFNAVDGNTATVVARMSDNATINGSNLIITANATGSNYIIIYIPIESNITYDFAIGNYSSLQSYGYKLADEISDSWNPGGFSNVASGTVTNGTHPYLCFMCVAVNTFSGTIPLTVKEHFADTLIDRVDDLEQKSAGIVSNAKTLENIENIFTAQGCTVKARFNDYVKLSGHEVVFSANTSGSNYANIYVPLKLGAVYTIDYGTANTLESYGMKIANAIADDAGNQGFVNNVTGFVNDGENNKYLVILLQAVSSFAGSIKITVKEDASNLKIRVGSGYAYSSILAALKNTPNNVELWLVDNEYDIQQEYTDFYGSTFWDNYSGYSGNPDYFMAGLWIDGNRRLIGTGNSVLKMQYDRDNTAVGENFSMFAFYPQASTVEISNFTIKYSGIKYAIHDDFVPQHAKIIMDGLIIDGTPASGAAIGAGLGIDTVYEIKNCVFLNNGKIYDISYHGSTNALTTNKCKVIVTNCLGSKGCAFRWYGASTAVTDCVVNNSKFGSIECIAYNDQQPNENMRLISYCNETT